MTDEIPGRNEPERAYPEGTLFTIEGMPIVQQATANIMKQDYNPNRPGTNRPLSQATSPIYEENPLFYGLIGRIYTQLIKDHAGENGEGDLVMIEDVGGSHEMRNVLEGAGLAYLVISRALHDNGEKFFRGLESQVVNEENYNPTRVLEELKVRTLANPFLSKVAVDRYVSAIELAQSYLSTDVSNPSLEQLGKKSRALDLMNRQSERILELASSAQMSERGYGDFGPQLEDFESFG